MPNVTDVATNAKDSIDKSKKGTDRYTHEQRIRIVQLYSEGTSSRYVQKKWPKDYNCNPPTANTITRIYQKFLETGSVANRHKKRARTSRTEENVEKVKQAFQKSPGKSIRKVAQELSIPHSTVSRILHELKGPEGGRIKRARALKLGVKPALSKSKSDANSLQIKDERNPLVVPEEIHVYIQPAEMEELNIQPIPSARSILASLMFTLNFAAEKHKHQRRKDEDQTPYINHPIGVANILIQEGGIEDVEIIQAAVLHDTVEDTDATIEELQTVFGSKVAGIVVELTDNKLLPKAERKLAQIQQAGHKSYGAQIVGMADKIHNLRDLLRSLPVGWDEQRRYDYFVWAKEVCRFYYPANSSLAEILQGIFTDQGLVD